MFLDTIVFMLLQTFDKMGLFPYAKLYYAIQGAMDGCPGSAYFVGKLCCHLSELFAAFIYDRKTLHIDERE